MANLYKDEPETRIKDITFRALKGKFVDLLKETQTTQIDYKTAAKSKITRQARAIDNTLTPEQIEEICNDPEVIYGVYMEFIII